VELWDAPQIVSVVVNPVWTLKNTLPSPREMMLDWRANLFTFVKIMKECFDLVEACHFGWRPSDGSRGGNFF
jgi:hypothetical protein